MHSLKFIRENKDLINQTITEKKCDIDLDEILSIDFKRRTLINEVETLKADRNSLNNQLSINKKEKIDISSLIEDMKNISIKIKALDNDLTEFNNILKEKVMYIPNVIHESVPLGKNELDNVIVKEWGSKPSFDFEILSHLDLCEKLNLVDFKRGSKISGSAFPLYLKSGAKLERSLINFMLDNHIKNGYNEIFPPFLVSSKSPFTTGNLPKFKDDMYYIENDDLFCIPTAEVPVTNIYRDEIVSENILPQKFVAYSACFRREAGSYGADVRGLNRLHQFDKVEIVRLEHPEKSYDSLNIMKDQIKGIIEKLGLPFRIITLCGGDLGFTSALTYDFEIYSPPQDKWLEVSSVSNFETFQSNRLKIRYRNAKGKTSLVHTLNGSSLALPRVLATILENFQTKDGIIIPKVLQEYTGFSIIK